MIKAETIGAVYIGNLSTNKNNIKYKIKKKDYPLII